MAQPSREQRTEKQIEWTTGSLSPKSASPSIHAWIKAPCSSHLYVLELISLIRMAFPRSSALYLVNLIFLLSLVTVTILVSRVDARRLGKPAAMEGVGETKSARDENGRKMVEYYLGTAEKNLGDMKNLPPFPLFPFPPIPEIPFPPPLVFPGVPPLPPFPMFPPLPPFHIPTIPFFSPPPP